MNPTRELSFFMRRLALTSYSTARPIRFFCTLNTCKDGRVQEKEALEKISNEQFKIPYKSSSLTTDILECTTQIHLFQLVNENQSKMKGREAIRALQTLFGVSKKNSDTEIIPSTKEFAILCEIIKKKVRQLSEGDAISALKILSLFKVSTSTVVVQMLLQLIRSSVNNLTIEQITFLNSILQKLEKTPLVVALTKALPIVLRTLIKTQLDTDNVDTLVDVLIMFTGESYDNDSVLIVLRALNRIDVSTITPKQARIIIERIEHFNHDSNSIEVLKKCQEVLINSINDITPKELTCVLNIVSYDSFRRSGIMFNERLLDAGAMAVVSKDMGLSIAFEVLKYLTCIGHSHKSLLDYVAEKWYEQIEADGSIKLNKTKTLIEGISIANYKPAILDMLEKSLQSNVEEASSSSSSSILEIAMNLVLIDWYWPKLLEKIFAMKNCYRSKVLCNRFLLLYNAVKTFHPQYDGPWPLDEILELCWSVVNFSHKNNTPFKTALEYTFGGPQYVINDVKTAMGYNIDHVAIITKEGRPVEFRNTPLMIEELKRSQDNHVLLFLYISEFGCARNIRCRGSYWYLLIRTLEAVTNCKVIPLHCEMSKQSKLEKQKYISQAINKAINSTVMNPPQSQIHE